MRILTLTNMFPPQALGGYELSCADVMARFVAAGHHVTVLTTDVDLAPEQRVAAEPPVGVGVERSLRWYWRDHRFVQPRLRERVLLELHNRRALNRLITTVQPDVVSVWGFGGMSMNLIDMLNATRVPCVYVVCDEWPIYGPRADAWIARATDGERREIARMVGAAARLPTSMQAPHAATFCWLSDYVRTRVLVATGWQPAHETITYSGVSSSDFPVTARRDRPWQWQLLAVGRVEPRKGFLTAVEALAELPENATLRIVGPDDGAHGDELRHRAAELGVDKRLSFDVVPRAQLRDHYDAADVLLFTSAWEEPFGLVPVEAMARALPVVAVPTGGASEYLVDGTNCIAVAGDADSLAAGVRRVADDAGLRAQIIEGGLRTAAELTVDRLAEVLERWHQAAADQFVHGEPAARATPALGAS